MLFRMIGAFFVLVGCCATGILVAANAKRETGTLKQLLSVIEYWKNDLFYRMTPLPELCRQASAMNSGILSRFMAALADDLDRQTTPNAQLCLQSALSRFPDFPLLSRQILEDLGSTLGHFDSEGQLNCFEHILKEGNRLLEHHCRDQEVRLRSYKTLGICAGVALIILFI